MKSCRSTYYTNEIVKKGIQLSFSIDNCTVTTETQVEGNLKSTRFKISIICQLKDYQSISDSAIFVRAKYLSVLGLISFLIDEPLDVFGNEVCHKMVDVPTKSHSNFIYIKGRHNYSNVLSNLLNKITNSTTHEKKFIFSLLDRWRKARYLEEETKNNLLFDDETTLSYFHVLELLGDNLSKEIKNHSAILIEEFLRKYNQNILSTPLSVSENDINSQIKLVSSILDKNITVYAKISHLLKKYKVFDERTSYWIKHLIDARNSVAHGRRVYCSKAIFPVRPFFSLISTDLYPLFFLRILSAKIIANYLGIKLFDKVWKKVHKELNYGEVATRDLLLPQNFAQSNSLSAKHKSIIYGGLNQLILNKKMKISECIEFYRFYLKSNIKIEEFAFFNSPALIILMDSIDDPKIVDKIISLFKLINNSNSQYYIKFRDLLHELEFYGFTAKKLEDLISSCELY